MKEDRKPRKRSEGVRASPRGLNHQGALEHSRVDVSLPLEVAAEAIEEVLSIRDPQTHSKETSAEHPPLAWQIIWVDPASLLDDGEKQQSSSTNPFRRLADETTQAVRNRLRDPEEVPFLRSDQPFESRENGVFVLEEDGWQEAPLSSFLRGEVGEHPVSAGRASFTLSGITSRDKFTSNIVDCLTLVVAGKTAEGQHLSFLAHIWPGILVRPDDSFSHLTALHKAYWQRWGDEWRKALHLRRAHLETLLRARLESLRRKVGGSPLSIGLSLGGFTSRSHSFRVLLAQLEAAHQILDIAGIDLSAQREQLRVVLPVGQVPHPRTGEWLPGVHTMGIATHDRRAFIARPAGEWFHRICTRAQHIRIPASFSWSAAQEIACRIANKLGLPPDARREVARIM